MLTGGSWGAFIPELSSTSRNILGAAKKGPFLFAGPGRPAARRKGQAALIITCPSARPAASRRSNQIVQSDSTPGSQQAAHRRRPGLLESRRPEAEQKTASRQPDEGPWKGVAGDLYRRQPAGCHGPLLSERTMGEVILASHQTPAQAHFPRFGQRDHHKGAAKRCGSAVELQAGDGDIRLKFFPDSHYGDPLEAPGVQFGL